MLSLLRHSWCPLKNCAEFSLSAVVIAKSHYDVLGITPHATQNDIKTAYYKLSMKYHPDKNKGSDEASLMFREITNAYEILGNYRLRKLYDKGMLHTAGSNHDVRPEDGQEDDAQTKFYKSRLTRDKPPSPTGRTSIYDFDEWSRAHYGNLFERKAAYKIRMERRKEEKIMNKNDFQTEIVIFGLGLCFMFGSIVSIYSTADYDDVSSLTEGEDSPR